MNRAKSDTTAERTGTAEPAASDFARLTCEAELLFGALSLTYEVIVDDAGTS